MPAVGDMCDCLPWPIDPTCCPTWPETWEEISGPTPVDRGLTSEEVAALRARAIASERLRTLTAWRWGLCEDLVRPCGPPQCQTRGYPAASYGVLNPVLSAGRMYNSGCCACSLCEPCCTVYLPGPVHDVLHVQIDGRELVRGVEWDVNGEGGIYLMDGCWPHGQDLRRPCGSPGTWCVRYLRGIDPASSWDAIRAVSALACHLYQDACGIDCGPPRDATSVRRGDVEWERAPSTRDTGVAAADEWLDIVNPLRTLQVPRVYDPGAPRWRFRGHSECRRAADVGGVAGGR